MSTLRRLISKPLTKPGKHGALYHYVITYTDSSDPDFPDMTWKTWAYDSDHALDKFYDSGDDDGWKAKSWRRETEAPVHRQTEHSLLPPGTRRG
jgi:hypothetical protein